MNKVYLAHIRNNPDGSQTQQSAETHCRMTAQLAAQCLSDTVMENAAYLAGYLHDMGKFKQEFQEYLLKSANGEDTVKGSVIHTFAGVKYILERYWKPEDETFRSLVAEIIAYAIGAHHGLFDIEGSNKVNGFSHRLETENTFYEESRKNFCLEVLSENQMDQLMDKAETDMALLINQLVEEVGDACGDDEDRYNSEICFYIGLIMRMLLSSVIEGDRTDTVAFMTEERNDEPISIDWNECLKRVEDRLDQYELVSGISIARRKISDICKEKANYSPGIFRLNVPTGAGKTLSSLRFALAHAAIHQKKRIIFAVPLLSILEQNATVIRDFVADDDIILEHHSNISQGETGEDNGERDALLENWESPIIITTLVQLLDTMFGGKTSNIRRFHSLVDSIIVIDEVQTVPINILSLFELAVNYLSNYCGATVVLCSATQPAFLDTEHPFMKEPIEIVPFDTSIWKVFERTEIVDGGSLNLDEISDFAFSLLNGKKSGLIVCNKKKEAQNLFDQFKRTGITCFQLSASMCMDHRRRVLAELMVALKQATTSDPVLCISTQVIEAGVDISFDLVIRFSAGMDSIVQSAGRCNRNAEQIEKAPVYIISVNDENLSKLREIKRGQDATRELLYHYHEDNTLFDCNLASDKAIEFYYRSLYRDLQQRAMDYPISNPQCTLLDLMGLNGKYNQESNPFINGQAFALAGKLFKVFDSDSIDVVVPYGTGSEIIQKLLACSETDYILQKALIKEAKPYTVSVYAYQREKLEKAHGLTWTCGNTIAVLSSGYYDDDVGFTDEIKEMGFLEV